MSAAKLRIPTELIFQALGIPLDTEVIAVFNEYRPREIEMIVSHPDIPDGTQSVTPEIIKHHAECGHIVKTEMVDWGASEICS